jgi:hypothetical protein
MTTWNYRIVRTTHQLGGQEHQSFTIREVYYDDDGKITSWTAEPCYPAGDTWMECADDHAVMGRAVGQPVVDVSSGKAVEVPLLRRKR